MLGDNPLGNVLKDMKKNLAPLPDEYVEAQLLDIVNRSGGKITKIERGKTLGCASVAQAILCKIKDPGDDKLKSFAESMGTAIKQNLKAASKCIDMKLVNASA